MSGQSAPPAEKNSSIHGEGVLGVGGDMGENSAD